MSHYNAKNTIMSPSITVLFRQFIFPIKNPGASRENMGRRDKAAGTQPTLKATIAMPATHIIGGWKGVRSNVKNKFQKTIRIVIEHFAP